MARSKYICGFLLLVAAGSFSSRAASLYSIGEPTAEEQLYVELINRARANPPAEGQRLKNTTDPEIRQAYTHWKVDTNLMAIEFAAIPPAPPLSINTRLTAAARAHSQDMRTRGFQSHTGSNGSSVASRIQGQGYSYIAAAENIFSYSKSVPYGHAAFEVDWGSGGVGGMLTPRVHRNNIHNPIFREIGVGNTHGVIGNFGPQFVAQDFGTAVNATPFITGVAFRDHNNNGFYDMGEGLGGVNVAVSGAAYYAVTSSSGGYSVPVAGNGNYTVNFSAPGYVGSQKTVLVSSLANVKADYIAQPATGAGNLSAQLSRPVKISATQARFDATISGGTATAVEVQSTPGFPASWTKDNSVTISQISATQYRLTCNTSSGRKFYRLVVR